MHALLGEEAEAFFESLSQPPPVSIRLNPRKPFPVEGEPVPWCEAGRYLPERPAFTEDPYLHAGAYYVQEAGSMAIECLLDKTKPLAVLDLCAAPGGKATHLLALLPEGSMVVSNEHVKSRLPALKHNLARWGYVNHAILNADAKAFSALPGFFDVILCDAPCSGEGLFRKDPTAMSHWSPEKVKFNASRQRSIVADVWPALKPGGTFIYSTCTYNRVENDDNVEWIMKHQGAEEMQGADPIPAELAASRGHGLRTYPHRHRAEGFFAAAMIKPGGHQPHRIARHVQPAPVQVAATVKGWVREPDRFEFVLRGNTVCVVPADQSGTFSALELLKPVSSGTRIAQMKGALPVPAPELALSCELNRDAFPVAELNHAQALRYLRGATDFDFPGENGFFLMDYKGLPLGFSKKAAGRFNNLLPNSWYIKRSGISTEG